ncbi:MAG: transposase, partial [Bdellovibrionales bacterium]|nr:transposase [Bdellovibrionales bacterium]
FSKYFQALTLYRLEELFSIFTVQLSRGTMARWLIKLSEKLMPIWNVLSDKVQDCGYQVIDGTRVQVLKEKGRKPQTDS